MLSRQEFPKAVTPPSFGWPEYSPDGERIIFTCVGCERELSLWVVPVRGGSPARVAGDQDGGLAATWSPDGQWIAYVNTGHLVKLRVGGGRPVALAERCNWPSWSPGGEALACLGELGLELVSPDGSRLRRFDGSRGESAIPSFTWSRDGRSIFYIRPEPGRAMLERLDVNTGRFTPITELPAGFRQSSPMAGARLSLSADGKTLGISVVAGDSDIWILDGFEAPRGWWANIWSLKR